MFKMLRDLARSRPPQPPATMSTAPTSAPAFSKDEDLSRLAGSYLKRLEAGEYDFVDLGTCDGGGFTIAERLGGSRGLGFDLEPAAVHRALAKGQEVALYDVCDLHTEEARVSFAVCSHVLEHLPGLREVERVLAALLKLCSDFVIISGPLFDHEDYLLELGLKPLQSLMLDHTCKFELAELQAILHALGQRDYVIALSERMENSDNYWLYGADQTVPPEGLWTYDPSRHRPKPKTNFDRTIHRDFVCVIPLNDHIRVDGILDRFYWGYDKIIVRSNWAFSDTTSAS